MFDFAARGRDPDRLFILNRRTGEPEHASTGTWAYAMRSEDYRLRLTRVGKRVVATVFTGYDDRDENDDGKPIVFATVIEPDDAVRSYRTIDEARSGHDEAVASVARETGHEPIEIDLNPPQDETMEDPK